ncbi:hypothetical protein ILUMI_04363 [Ignelater luminosus]|uniref:Peptidase S1 domain-containing protein n=1 Tax=Ignelater luminosus TaxID=2038154 RepID=A0A8K0DCQ9_IGNLU|nr:hypothetical protein ILUMI_04363 [Ignelater luminosus]
MERIFRVIFLLSVSNLLVMVSRQKHIKPSELSFYREFNIQQHLRHPILLDNTINYRSMTFIERNARIIEGRFTDIRNYPSMACLIVKEPRRIHFRGGASIISAHWVVTAAHCLLLITDNDIHNKRAYVRSNSTTWIRDYADHLAIRRYAHEEFNLTTMDYDVGLIKVKEKFEPPNEVPIKFVRMNYRYVDDTNVTMLGWGSTTIIPPYSTTQYLLAANLTITNFEKCQTSYRYRPYDVTDRMVCAAAPGRGACVYDSGGPVLQNGTLIGIISWGSNVCAYPRLPTVYTKLSLFYYWIRDKIDQKKKRLLYF